MLTLKTHLHTHTPGLQPACCIFNRLKIESCSGVVKQILQYIACLIHLHLQAMTVTSSDDICSSELLFFRPRLLAARDGSELAGSKTACSAALLQLDGIDSAWFHLLRINDTVCPCALKMDTRNNAI